MQWKINKHENDFLTSNIPKAGNLYKLPKSEEIKMTVKESENIEIWFWKPQSYRIL